MNTNKTIYALIILIVVIECFAWYFLKQYTLNSKLIFLWCGICCYAFIAYLIARILFYKVDLGIANAYWNVFSTMSIALVGVLLFSDKYSTTACVGMLLGVSSIYLLTDH
jgi:multidrug transporter EmrE-like cation transporter